MNENEKKLSFIIVGVLSAAVLILAVVLIATRLLGPAEPNYDPDQGTVPPLTTEAPPDPTTIPEETQTPTAATEPDHVHTYTASVTEASCTERGYTTYTCQCGDTYKDRYHEELGHTWSGWKTVQNPTPSQTGRADRKCQNCGDIESRVLPKVEAGHIHSYTGAVTKEATCTAQGVKTYTCSCGDKYAESIKKISHEYTMEVTKPACLSRGYTTYSCKTCDDSYQANHVPATGHKWPGWIQIQAPTQTEDGWAERACTACGEKQTRVIPALDHTHQYEEKVTKPTCTQQGYTTHTCSCGDTYEDTYVDATGHRFMNAIMYCTNGCGTRNPSYGGTTDPDPTDPPETEPDPTDPSVTEPDPTDPPATGPDPTDPSETEPDPTEPSVTEPDPTDPPATETDPPATEQPPTDPPVAESDPTDPPPAEPEE